jgi:hypothetical protein
VMISEYSSSDNFPVNVSSYLEDMVRMFIAANESPSQESRAIMALNSQL